MRFHCARSARARKQKQCAFDASPRGSSHLLGSEGKDQRTHLPRARCYRYVIFVHICSNLLSCALGLRTRGPWRVDDDCVPLPWEPLKFVRGTEVAVSILITTHCNDPRVTCPNTFRPKLRLFFLVFPFSDEGFFRNCRLSLLRKCFIFNRNET